MDPSADPTGRASSARWAIELWSPTGPIDRAVVADRPDLRLRKGAPIELLGGHWTGGPIREGEDAAVRTVASMHARKRDDGSLMDVSCHFVIGWDGGVWQVADLALATVHMGRAVNGRSIGVETTWPGYASQAVAIRGALAAKGQQPHTGYSGPVDVRTVRGRQVECLRPSAALVASWVALAELLADLSMRRPELGLRIPRRLAVPAPGRWPKAGALEHWQAPSSRKDDAAGYLCDALTAAGWASR